MQEYCKDRVCKGTVSDISVLMLDAIPLRVWIENLELVASHLGLLKNRTSMLSPFLDINVYDCES